MKKKSKVGVVVR